MTRQTSEIRVLTEEELRQKKQEKPVLPPKICARCTRVIPYDMRYRRSRKYKGLICQRCDSALWRAKGYSFERIAQETGISKPTLIKMQGEYQDKVREAKYYELENIVNSYGVMRRNRFETFSKVLGAALQELNQRAENNQLSRIPADKLLSLALSLEQRLEQDTKKELVSVKKDKSLELSRIIMINNYLLTS